MNMLRRYRPLVVAPIKTSSRMGLGLSPTSLLKKVTNKAKVLVGAAPSAAAIDYKVRLRPVCFQAWSCFLVSGVKPGFNTLPIGKLHDAFFRGSANDYR